MKEKSSWEEESLLISPKALKTLSIWNFSAGTVFRAILSTAFSYLQNEIQYYRIKTGCCQRKSKKYILDSVKNSKGILSKSKNGKYMTFKELLFDGAQIPLN